MPVSSPSSRTRWNMRVAIRRRKQGGWRETLLPDILSYDPRARRPSRTMAGHSPTMSVDVFLAILTNGKVTEDKVGRTAICWPSSPTWGRRNDQVARQL